MYPDSWLLPRSGTYSSPKPPQKVKNIETAVQKIPEITEKFGELKKRCDPAAACTRMGVSAAKERAPRHWRQIAFIVIAAVAGWSARSGRI